MLGVQRTSVPATQQFVFSEQCSQVCMQLALAPWMRTVLLLRRPLRSGVGPGRGSPPGSVLDSRSAEVCGQLAAWGGCAGCCDPCIGLCRGPPEWGPCTCPCSRGGLRSESSVAGQFLLHSSSPCKLLNGHLPLRAPFERRRPAVF